MEKDEKHQELLAFTTEIVSAHLSNNKIDTAEIPELIGVVYQTLNHLNAGSTATMTNGNLKPAVPIEESVQDDHLVCLEDGKKLKLLKRYLKTFYDMSPEDYRKKWGLAPDYPMVAPSYAKKRSRLAKDTGFGKKGK